MERFDVIVIGAGPAGATAAKLLAEAGVQVLLVERGPTPGSKNVSGGLIYSRVYNEFYPNFWESAPVERAIVEHSLVMLGEESAVSLDYRSGAAAKPPYNAFSVLRAKFDPWLAAQAEAAGATLITGITVDELLLQEGRVVGIRAGENELGADVVVIAEGSRSLLLRLANLRAEFHPRDVSLGVKEVIALPAETLQERFRCAPGQGAAYTLLGHTGGVEGGGFLYTNRDSLSLGIVVKIEGLAKSGRQPHDLLDEFKAHPWVSRLIEGGRVIEYSAQSVHRGGVHLISGLYGDGYVVAGSAARLLLNNMLTLRGMDLAVSSAAAAARAILQAREKKDYTRASLSAYETLLHASSPYRDMVTFKDVYPLLENKRLFQVYPDLACAVLEDLFGVSTQPSVKALASLRRHMQGKVSWVDLAKDGLQIGRGVAL